MAFLPPNVDPQTGDSYVNPGTTPGLYGNPILAALSGVGGGGGAQPAPAGVPAGTPAAAPASGGFLSSLFGGGAANPMGNPIGNALMGHGNFLVPLLAGLLGGKTPEQQRLAAAQAAAAGEGTATASGLTGLTDAIAAAGGNQNRGIHDWLHTKAGSNFFVANGEKATGMLKDYLASTGSDAGQTAEQKNFNYMLKQAGITDPTLAAKAKLGLLKTIPRTSRNATGDVVATGEYDVIDLSNGEAHKVGTSTAPIPTAPGTAAAPTGGAAPAVPGAAASASAPASTTESFHPLDADVAEGGGWVPHYLQKGGSALSNVAPKAFSTERAAKINGLKQIDAATSSLLDLYKRGGIGGVVAPVTNLLHVSDLASSSPQDAVASMIAGRQWAEREAAGARDILADPAQAKTDAATKANLQLHALTKYLSILPPMKTTTYPDGTVVMGLQEEAEKLHNAPATQSPIGGLISGIPTGAKEAGDAALDIGKSVGKALGTGPEAAQPGTSKDAPIVYEDPKKMMADFNGGKLAPGSWVQYTDPKTHKPMLGHIPETAHGKY